MNAIPEFTGGAMTFSVTGEGVAIDPAAGRLTIRADALDTGVAVGITARAAGGAVTGGFRLMIGSPAAPETIVPVMIEAPALLGTGVIGAAVTLEPGVWSGTPAPTLAFQWRRDGVDMPGVDGTEYLPGAADDRTALCCAVIARNAAGDMSAVTEPLGVTYPAPAATGALDDLALTVGSGAARVEAARVFAGEALVYSVTGAGATIDAASGVISLPTDAPRAQEPVTVSATNSGGVAMVAFKVSVGAAPAFTTQPTLSGSGKVGEAVTFNSGTVTGTPTPTKARAWYLDGAAISGQTAATYTPAAADAGKTLKGRETAANSAGTAQSDFTNNITIIAATGDYVTVTNKADLQTALNSAVAGRIILVGEGNYAGAVVATNGAKNFKTPVTIQARDRARPPIFTTIGFNLANWSGLTFDGLSFKNTAVDDQGDQTGKNIQLNGCKRVKIVDCYFSRGHETIRADNTEDFEVAYCTFEECGMDNGRFYAGQKNLWLHHNKIWKTAVDESRVGEADRHPDGFQFAVNTTDTPPDGVLVEDNWIENRQTGHSMHGVFFGNNACRPTYQGGLGKSLDESGYKNLTVRRNYLYLGHIQGIALEGTRNATVEQNLMRTIPGVTNNGDKPTVYFLWEKFENITIRNNVFPRQIYKSNVGGSGSQISEVNNVVSDTAVPNGWADTDVAKTLAGNVRVGQYAAR